MEASTVNEDALGNEAEAHPTSLGSGLAISGVVGWWQVHSILGLQTLRVAMKTGPTPGFT